MSSSRPIDRRRSELTPAQRALLELRLRGQRGDTGPVHGIARRDPAVAAPLSFAQERLWFLDQLNPGDTTYNCIDTLPFDFAVDIPILKRSLNEIVRRHESLRTTFPARDGIPVQVVAPTLELDLPVIDLRHLRRSERGEEARRLAAEEAAYPFDLATGPLLRTTLLRTGDERYVFVLTMHHIVGDGWSMGVFWRELTAIWEAFASGLPSPLPELAIQYADFAVWQRNSVSGVGLARHLGYWRQQLSGLPVLQLPTDRPRPAVQRFRGARQPLVLTRSLTAALNDLSRREGATLFMTLLAAFNVLLHRYTAQEDFAVGTYVAGRDRVELEPLIGFFINTLVMRTSLSGDPTFRQVLARVKESALGAYSHQDVPFALLVQELRPDREPGRNPVFQVVFHLFNAPNWDPRDFSTEAPPHDVTQESAAFDLVLTLMETTDGLAGAFEYDTDLFEASTIARMAGQFVTLLEGLVAHVDVPVIDVPIMTASERQTIVYDWNRTDADYPEGSGLTVMFEEQVNRTPDAPAFVDGETILTYRTLDRAAKNLAARLTSSGWGKGTYVGVLQSRGLHAAVSLMAILNAGAVYVPLDVSYPRDRLSFILNEAGVQVILTTRQHAAAVGGLGATVVYVDEVEPGSPESSIAPTIRSGPEDIAYVIFTSGSTGRPKGVAIPHRQLLNRLWWMYNAYPFEPGEVSCVKTRLSFVDSLWELLGPLLKGISSVIVSDDILKDPMALVDTLARHRVSRIWLVPSLLKAILAAAPDVSRRLPDLRFWVTTGEALPVELFRRFQDAMPGKVLYNLYGTSEVWDATWFDPQMDGVNGHATAIPIGRPISNVQTFVLDRRLHPVPIGVRGELFVAGEGLAAGYLNQPDLTAAKFVDNPFSDRPAARMYKTGDTVRYREDGNIEYIGRYDEQVKLRGFRLDLGDIESVLVQHPSVRDVKVALREDGSQEASLVAYLVVSQDQDGLSPDAQEGDEPGMEAVPQWQEVWDEAYREPRVDGDDTFNISGFDSSYTGLPIPADEVREWVNQAVDRILAPAPPSVFEMGCGAGLLLFRIAPKCTRYIGADFSPVAVERLRSHDAMRRLPHVEVIERRADDLGGIDTEPVDAFVLNSVAQYFPSIEYLVDVLETAVDMVKPGGFIFVGDVRSLPLLEMFHASVELRRAGPEVSVGRLRGRVQQRVRADEELVIDPAFFRAFGAHMPEIGAIEIIPKRGRYHNEFTCFRYDVLLHARPAGAVAANPLRLDWEDDRLTLQALRDLLERDRPDVVEVRRVPNSRLSLHHAALRLMEEADPRATVNDIRHYVRTAPAGAGVDPEALWALADTMPYTVDLSWPGPGADDRLNVCLRRHVEPGRPASAIAHHLTEPSVGAPEAWRHYANNPVHGNFTRRVVPAVSRFARTRLPEFMVPSAYVVMDRLPLNANGKVDRQKLPAPDASRSRASTTFVSPRSSTEQALTTMFIEALGVDHVGVNDDFFADLGGHSLLATRIVSRIREAFRLDLPLRTIFEAPTVAGLARHVEEAGNGHDASVPIAIERISRGASPPSGRQVDLQ